MTRKTAKNYMKSKKPSIKHEPSKMSMSDNWDIPDYKLKIGGGMKGGELAGFSMTTIVIVIIVVIVVIVGGYFLFFNKSGFYMVSNSPIRFLTPNKNQIDKDRPLINENHAVGCAFAKNNAACDPTREVFGVNDDINIRNMVDAQQAKIFRDLQVPVKKIVADNSMIQPDPDTTQTNSPLYNQMIKDVENGDSILDNTLYVNRNDIPNIIRNSTETDYYGDFIKNNDINNVPGSSSKIGTQVKNSFGGYPMPH